MKPKPVAGTIILLGAWLLALGSVPRVNAQAASPLPPSLTAQGHAEIKVPADIATLTISVTSTARSEVAAAQDNAARTAALIGAIKKLKIPSSDIQTADYRAGRQFNTNSLKPAFIGYLVTNAVQVTLHDVALASRLIDAAAQSGATRITALNFSLSDRQATENQAYAQAAANARSHAQAIATAMNIRLGSLRSVSDGEGTAFVSLSDSVAGTAPAEFATTTPISPQEITVTADVTVNYDIAQ